MYASYSYAYQMSAIWIWTTGLIFATIHSVLATQRCKDIFYPRGMSPKSYRLAYSILAVILTMLWFDFVHQLPDVPLYHMHGWENTLMRVIQITGLGVVVLSLRAINTAAFLGLSASDTELDAFTDKGIYRYVRHPMYSGVMLVLLASSAQTVNNLNLFAVITAYLIIGSKFEERRMLITHPQYAEYQHRVPAFVPRLRKEAGNE